jgi:hypothetical protein
MMLLLPALSVLLLLLLAKRVAEPACPACSGKSWNDQPPRLVCAGCGWSNLFPAVASAPRESGALQYEIGLSG